MKGLLVLSVLGVLGILGILGVLGVLGVLDVLGILRNCVRQAFDQNLSRKKQSDFPAFWDWKYRVFSILE